MANRRALIEGLNSDEEFDADAAEQFITGRKSRPAAKAKASNERIRHAQVDTDELPVPEGPQPEPNPPPAPAALPRSLVPANAPATSHLAGVSRMPMGARVRTDIATAIKRESLERQLKGIVPNSIQDIHEEALELWLHTNGLRW